MVDSPLFMKEVIATSPKIAVTVQAQGDTLLRITLAIASAFTLECSSPLLRSALIPWLERYSAGKWSPFPVPLPQTPFTQKVALHLQNTSLGQVLSYGELAAAIGHPKAARAVGNFCRGNLFPLLIPCHRVVPQSKEIGKFTPDPKIKEHLLRFEGLYFTDPIWHTFCIYIVTYNHGDVMNKEEMLKRISELESLNDQLITEISSLDRLLKKIGFERGVVTLKIAAQELLEENPPMDDVG